MDTFIYAAVFMFGTIIGSFLNVVIYRLHTGRSLNGSSHCMSCGKMLAWFELFPVLSYVLLRGKCRGCSSYIPSRYLMVELLTGALYLLVWHLYAGNIVLTILNAVLVSALVVIAVYDIRHTIIPDEMTVLIGTVAAAFLAYQLYLGATIASLVPSLGAGVIAFVFFGGLWYISKGRWLGFGDAKLALPLGVIVGLGGVFSMIVLSFWVGAAITLVLLTIERISKKGKTYLHFLSAPLTIKSEVPFAPFLMLGFLLVHFFYANIFIITQKLFLF